MKISPYAPDKSHYISPEIIRDEGPAFFVSCSDRNLTEIILLSDVFRGTKDESMTPFRAEALRFFRQSLLIVLRAGLSPSGLPPKGQYDYTWTLADLSRRLVASSVERVLEHRDLKSSDGLSVTAFLLNLAIHAAETEKPGGRSDRDYAYAKLLSELRDLFVIARARTAPEPSALEPDGLNDSGLRLKPWSKGSDVKPCKSYIVKPWKNYIENTTGDVVAWVTDDGVIHGADSWP